MQCRNRKKWERSVCGQQAHFADTVMYLHNFKRGTGAVKIKKKWRGYTLLEGCRWVYCYTSPPKKKGGKVKNVWTAIVGYTPYDHKAQLYRNSENVRKQKLFASVTMALGNSFCTVVSKWYTFNMLQPRNITLGFLKQCINKMNVAKWGITLRWTKQKFSNSSVTSGLFVSFLSTDLN